MNLQELKAAIDAFQETNAWPYAVSIADAFCDPAPLTREGLEAAGGKLFLDVNDMNYSRKLIRFKCAAGYELKVDPNSLWFYGQNPQPETRGDLNFLLWRLSRTTERKGE